MAVVVTYPDSLKIVVKGGTSGTPATFADLYEADLQGTLILLDRTIDGTPDVVSLGTQVQPGDSLQLPLMIGTSVDRAGATITITGRDLDGDVIEETLGIATAATTLVITTLKFAYVETSGVSIVGMTDGDTVFIFQNRWGVISPQLGPELITNGIMELNSNWANWNSPTTNERSGVQKHTGTYSRKFTVDAGNEGIKGDTYTTVTGKKYVVSLWVYPDDATVVQLFVNEGGGTTVYNESFTGLTQDAWNKIEFVYEETDGGGVAFLNINSGVLTSGSWYVDSVSIKEILPQYKIDTDVDFGDGSTPTYFQSKNELVYFADGEIFTIKSAATLKCGELVDDWGIDGSAWSVGPSANWSIVLGGQTTASLLFYSGYLYTRTNREVIQRDGAIDARNFTFFGNYAGTNTGGKLLFKPEVTSISFNRTYISNQAYFQMDKTPALFNKVHSHYSYKGITINLSETTITEYFQTSVVHADEVTAHTGTPGIILKDPLFTLTSPRILGAGVFVAVQYTCNIHVTDKDGADLQNVTVDCEYANLVEGSDSKTYKCVQDHTSVDATHKPITGSAWDEYWELYDAAGGLGGPWQTTYAFKAGTQEFAQQTTGADGDISEQVIQYKKWVGTSELLEARIHKFTFAHASYPDMTIEDVIVNIPIVWRLDMGQSDANLTTLMETAIDNKIDTTAGKIDGVALVDVTTLNSDMVGTDNARKEALAAPD